MERHLVIFARAPALGRVKRRLAAGIGPVAALAFYRRTFRALWTRLAGDPRWTTSLAVTPDGAAETPRLWPPGARLLGQGGGDLGERMLKPMRPPPVGLPPGPVVIVGSDIPDVRPAHIARAFQALGDHGLVFGPATDGGFWLVGARRSPRWPRGLFDHVRWSGAHALSDTLRNARGRFTVALIDELADVDDRTAYDRLRERAPAAPLSPRR